MATPALKTTTHHRRRAGHTRNLINIQQRQLDYSTGGDAAVNYCNNGCYCLRLSCGLILSYVGDEARQDQ